MSSILAATLSRRALLASLAGLSVSAAAGRSRAAGPGRVTDTVRLCWGFGNLTLVSKERGEFEKRLGEDGIKVEWLGPFPNHAPTLQAVTGGSADFSFGGSTTVGLAAIVAGSPLVFAQFMVYEPRTSAIIAKDDSGINSVEDLVGKSVAVNRSGLGEFLLVAALEKHKIDRSKVKFVYLNPPDAAPALASGKVDAWSMWSPGVDIARLEYKAHDLFLEGRDLDFQIDFSAFLVTREFSEKNRELVQAVNAAYQAEADWVSHNTREAELIAQRRAGYSDEIRDQFVARKRQYHMFSVTDAAFVAGLQKAADWLTERKVLPESVAVAEHLVKG
jgi:sulfonate transport system substrate-binding protein